MSRRLAALRRLHGDEVYARFIHMVSHLDLSPGEARSHWEAIALHTRQLARRLDRAVDYRVGLTDYFVHMAPRIRNPKVIEIHLFNETQAGTLKDGLTGLYNFRFFQEALLREFGQARRLDHPLGLVFVDVDHFKRYNDSQGHAAGNAVLQKVAKVLREAVRDMDLACRYGGEEFVLLLPATDAAGALKVAERVVLGAECLRIPHPAISGSVTVSAGATSFPEDADGPEDLVEAADQAMYRAKSLGRNRAASYSPERRRHERHPADFRGAAESKGGAKLPLTGRDLSQGGLFFVTPEAISKGQTLRLVLEFPSPGSPRKVACEARVARCVPTPGGVFGVGVALTQIAPADRLRFFQTLSEAQRARRTSSERR